MIYKCEKCHKELTFKFFIDYEEIRKEWYLCSNCKLYFPFLTKDKSKKDNPYNIFKNEAKIEKSKRKNK